MYGQDWSDKHFLYRLFDQGGKLLYIGMTKNPGNRLNDHLQNKEWAAQIASMALMPYPNREELRIAERHAIRTEEPLYNVQHNGPERRVTVHALRYDITDAGEAIVVIKCPFCRSHHWHYEDTKVGQPSCGGGQYRILDKEMEYQ